MEMKNPKQSTTINWTRSIFEKQFLTWSFTWLAYDVKKPLLKIERVKRKKMKFRNTILQHLKFFSTNETAKITNFLKNDISIQAKCILIKQ